MTDDLDFSPDRPARILIVDDEPLNVDYLEQELEALGFVTESATNGIEALDRVAATSPDLVLLDVMMPGMDGISALRILKGDPETRLIPVVLMTALNSVEDRVRGIDAGADDFLSKPVDDRELLARIRTALRQKRSVDLTVDELRTTSAHLERYGRQSRDIVVLAIEWRPSDASLPREAAAFVGRRERTAAEEYIRKLGGVPIDSEDAMLVAIFEGPDASAQTIVATTAATAISSLDPDDGEGEHEAPSLLVRAAVAAGQAEIGSFRKEVSGETRWVYGAAGPPVGRAIELARESSQPGTVVALEIASLAREHFLMEPVGEGAYRVVSRASFGEDTEASERPSDRAVRTILVTDIVGSTRMAERVGDRAWVELVAAHDRATRAELVLFGGEVIDGTGDGFLAAFGGPARAIRCALAILDRVAVLGLTMRAGIHTGEVELVEGETRGIALSITTRIAAKADPGEVLVSATTRELAVGSGLTFADRGEHSLKGVTEARRLYAVIDSHATTWASSRVDRGWVRDPAMAAIPAGLTVREVDVLKLVAIGMSDAEVARQLFLSVRTVNAHLRSIYRKIGVRSRSAAGRYAEENGLL